MILCLIFVFFNNMNHRFTPEHLKNNKMCSKEDENKK